MNLSIHPDPKCQQKQAEFLKACPPEERRFHELLLTYGNIIYNYHQGAKKFNPTQSDWNEWIEGLAEPMRSSFRKKGFEDSKGVLSFTRFVKNEKNDIGLQEFVRQNMNPDDYSEYKILVEGESKRSFPSS